VAVLLKGLVQQLVLELSKCGFRAHSCSGLGAITFPDCRQPQGGLAITHTQLLLMVCVVAAEVATR
jgi:hypothetical protein